MNPEELLRLAEQALALTGGDTARVNRNLAELSQGQYTSIEQLRRAISPADGGAQRMPRHRAALLSALHGVTQGFADEGVGVVAGAGARDRMRAQLAEAQAEYPLMAGAAEFVGGALLPGGIGAGVGRRVARATASRVLGGAAGGAVGGAAGGAVYGVGVGETLPDRLVRGATGAGTGAVAGGGLGTLGGLFARGIGHGDAEAVGAKALRDAFGLAGVSPGALGAVMGQLGPQAVPADVAPALSDLARAAANRAPALRRMSGPVERIRERHAHRGERLHDALAERVPAGDVPLDRLRVAAQENLRRVAREVYGPLEEAFPEVTGPNVRQVMSRPEIARIANRRAPGVPETRNPSFLEMQDMLMDLRDRASAAQAAGRPNAARRAREAHDALADAMRQDIPGFDRAQRAYMEAAKTLEAYDLGRKYGTRTAADMREAQRELPTAAHAAFRRGLFEPVRTRLLDREGGAAAGGLMRPGRVTRERLRVMLGEDIHGSVAPSPAQPRPLSDILDAERHFATTARGLLHGPTTARQFADAYALEHLRPGVISRIVNRAVGWLELSPADQRRGYEIVGEVLLTQGEAAAERVAQLIAGRRSVEGALGAIAGAGASRFILQQ